MKDKFVIERKRWLVSQNYIDPYNPRRNPNTEGFLCSKDGMMCCLGFYARHIGVSEKFMKQTASQTPYHLHVQLVDKDSRLLSRIMDRFKWLIAFDPDGEYTSAPADSLMRVNDNRDLTPRARESRIKRLFAEAGIEVVFKGDYRSKKISL